MNKKYYLLTMLLLVGMATYFQVDAKSTSSHVASKSSTASTQQSSTTNETIFENQNQSLMRPQIGQILFSGNTKISSDELKKNIPLKAQDVANENMIMDSMIKIAQLYKIKNIKVTITPLIENTGTNLINIHFDIHEIPMDKK